MHSAWLLAISRQVAQGISNRVGPSPGGQSFRELQIPWRLRTEPWPGKLKSPLPVPKAQQDSSTLPGESLKIPNLLCQHLKPNHNLHGVSDTGLSAHCPSGPDTVEKKKVTCERPADFLTVRISHPRLQGTQTEQPTFV